MPKPKKPARATPSKRLAAMAPAAARKPKAKPASKPLPQAGKLDDIRASVTIDGGLAVTGRIVAFEKPAAKKIRTKFVVVDKQEVPVVVGRDLETRYHVKFAPAYEARSILNGLATEKGNADNRIFGPGQPEAAIVMVLQSKAIADTFLTGRAFLVDFTEVVD